VQIFFKPDDLTRESSVSETRAGTVKSADPERDLAVVVPETLPSGYRYLKISARDDIEVGADVYAIGHPLGYTWTFTKESSVEYGQLIPMATITLQFKRKHR
jgi:S1-C subfamily serine protease